MKPILTSILLTMSLISLSAQDAKPPAAAPADGSVKHADAAAAKKLIDASTAKAKITVIDVRTPEEYKDGHIAGAQNIDIMSKEFADKLGALDKNATYVVHCQSGRRSTKSLETFKKLGFKSIVHLDGGFAGWQKAGLPVEK